MAKKRGQNEGSIFKRKDGRWCGTLNLGWENGRRKRKHFYGATQAEVRTILLRARHDLEQGLPVIPERQTVAQFLNQWLDESVKPNVKPMTYRSYGQMACLIAPELLAVKPRKVGKNGKAFGLTKTSAGGIGAVKLQKLNPQQIQSLLNLRLQEGLSPRTVQYILVVLRIALGQALKWGLVARNVAQLVDPPRVERRSFPPLTPQEAQQLLAAAKNDRLGALYSVALALGLRQGETLGLSWSDVDLDNRELRVRRALQRVDGKLRLVMPKSKQSQRVIALPDMVVKALHVHRARQLQERLLAGPQWNETGLVFTNKIGKPIEPRNLVRIFKRMLATAALPDRRFHDLRHSAASLLLAQGVHPRVVMETLGHSQISLTMNTYSHVFPALRREAADAMDAVLATR